MSADERRATLHDLPVAHDLRLDILPSTQRALWERLGDVPLDFVLYGGTAFALRRGHRESIDFDFFSSVPFSPGPLRQQLAFLGRVEVLDSRENTLTLRTPDGVRVSLFGGMDLQVVAQPSIAADNGLVIASIDDLGATKAKALLDRSEWRDYIDIDELLTAGLDLPHLIGCATAIFEPSFVFPGSLFLRSLVSFDDGTAPDVPHDVRERLEVAVRSAWQAEIPVVQPHAAHVSPVRPTS